MRRRQFIVTSGLAAVAALSGCLGNNSPPPRKSNVVSDFAIRDGSLVVDLADDTWITSRYDSGGGSSANLNPIGVASAKGKGNGGGRGATGRGTGGYSSAPRTRHGYAWYHGGDYADDWYEDHGDEVTRYGAVVTLLGVAYLGSNSQMQDEAPGPGPVPWDETIDDPGDTVEYRIDARDSFSQDGWYRVGANVVGTDVDHDFRWECYDLDIRNASGGGFTIEEQWKVSPRI